jgi:hypothetical protein
MTKTNLKQVEKKAKELNNDLLEVAKELKKIQSQKCRLKKMCGRSNYEELMTNVLKEEELLKQVRQLLDPKEKPVTMYDQKDVDLLDYDETIKAIRSIQSKKTLTRWLTDEDGNNDEYKNACKIEKMLIERRNIIKPIDNEHIRKSDLVTIIDTIESTNDISKERIVELLKNLL